MAHGFGGPRSPIFCLWRHPRGRLALEDRPARSLPPAAGERATGRALQLVGQTVELQAPPHIFRAGPTCPTMWGRQQV